MYSILDGRLYWLFLPGQISRLYALTRDKNKYIKKRRYRYKSGPAFILNSVRGIVWSEPT